MHTHAAPAVTASITPSQAAELVRSGTGLIVDVREPDEHRREHIPGSLLRPRSTFASQGVPPAVPGRLAFLVCNSGNQATQLAKSLRSSGRDDVSVIEGGIAEWRRAGLPVATDAKAPLPIVRQVMMVAGSMLVVFTALAATVSPWFLVGTGFVGAGLFVAGLTGFCPMANVLLKMPWNNASAPRSRANPGCTSSSCAP